VARLRFGQVLFYISAFWVAGFTPRLVKQVVFGIMDGSHRRGIPRRMWTVDVEHWCNMYLYTVA